MAVDGNERYRQQALDEQIYRAIKTADYRTALMALFVEVRGVGICKHGNMTTYQPCSQCDAEFDEWVSGGV